MVVHDKRAAICTEVFFKSLCLKMDGRIRPLRGMIWLSALACICRCVVGDVGERVTSE